MVRRVSRMPSTPPEHAAAHATARRKSFLHLVKPHWCMRTEMEDEPSKNIVHHDERAGRTGKQRNRMKLKLH